MQNIESLITIELNLSGVATMEALRSIVKGRKIRCFSSAVSNIVSQKSIEKNNEYLMTLLVCPLSKGPLEFDKASNCLNSHTANVAFPLSKDGCINMTVHDAHIIKTGTAE